MFRPMSIWTSRRLYLSKMGVGLRVVKGRFVQQRLGCKRAPWQKSERKRERGSRYFPLIYLQ